METKSNFLRTWSPEGNQFPLWTTAQYWTRLIDTFSKHLTFCLLVVMLAWILAVFFFLSLLLITGFLIARMTLALLRGLSGGSMGSFSPIMRRRKRNKALIQTAGERNDHSHS